MRASRSAGAALLLCAVLAAGCNEEPDAGGEAVEQATPAAPATPPSELTIYASLPLKGATSGTSESILNGMVMALEEADSTAAGLPVTLVTLDDSDDDGSVDEEQVRANAERAARDPKTIAYLGERATGGSKVAAPILNRGSVLHVSPTSSGVGLTVAEGAAPGEPQKYFPTGTRTFGRIVPNDNVQGTALAVYMAQAGCRRVGIVHDTSDYGRGLSSRVGRIAPSQGLSVGAPVELGSPDAAGEVAGKATAGGNDCVLYAGSVESGAVQVVQALAQSNVQVFGGDTLTASSFTEGIGAQAETRMHVTSPTLDPKFYPVGARDFFRSYAARFGGDPEPLAIFGYESMRAVLLAINNAGQQGNVRAAVVRAFFALRDVDGPVGRYSITPEGDSTIRTYGGYKINGGSLIIDRVLTADPIDPQSADAGSTDTPNASGEAQPPAAAIP